MFSNAENTGEVEFHFSHCVHLRLLTIPKSVMVGQKIKS